MSYASRLSRVGRSLRGLALSAMLSAALSLTGAATAHADEVILQNDSVVEGSTAAICPCFVRGEEVAVWLESPCDGDIVGIQVFWRSLLGGEQDSLENAIFIYDADNANFPVPGTLIETLLAPLLVDGVLNEYRFFDENQTVPIIIPVNASQKFVVSFSFENPNVGTLGPSLVFDQDGSTTGTNSIFAIPGGWSNAQTLGVTGDFFIRAVIDCDDVDPIGSCCLPDGSCMDGLTQDECNALSGLFSVDTLCGDISCPQPSGACCFSGGGCLSLTNADCAMANGMWAGANTNCPDDCVTACPGDINTTGTQNGMPDGQTNLSDLQYFLTLYQNDLGISPGSPADVNTTGTTNGMADGEVNLSDLQFFLTAWQAGLTACP